MTSIPQMNMPAPGTNTSSSSGTREAAKQKFGDKLAQASGQPAAKQAMAETAPQGSRAGASGNSAGQRMAQHGRPSAQRESQGAARSMHGQAPNHALATTGKSLASAVVPLARKDDAREAPRAGARPSATAKSEPADRAPSPARAGAASTPHEIQRRAADGAPAADPARFTPAEFDDVAADPSNQAATTMIKTLGNPRVRQNGAWDPQYQSWRNYPQDRSYYSNTQMRREAQADVAEKRQVSVQDASGHEFGRGSPITHPKFGVGWEFKPSAHFSGSPQDKNDTVPYRVFFDQNANMNVFRQTPAGNWKLDGHAVGNYQQNYADRFGIVSTNDFSSKGAQLSTALSSLASDAKSGKPNSIAVDPKKLQQVFKDLGKSGVSNATPLMVKVQDFTTYDGKPESIDLTKVGDSNYAYDSVNGALYFNSHGIASTGAGLKTEIHGLNGKNWNKEFVFQALTMVAHAKQSPDGLPPIVTNSRGFDYGRGKEPAKGADENFAFGYGHSQAWGGQMKYGAFSTMIANHQLGIRHPQLAVDLQAFDGKTAEQKANIKLEIDKYTKAHDNLAPADIKAIVDFGAADGTKSVFEEEQSVIQSGAQNVEFLKAMPGHMDLMPVSGRFEQGADKRVYEGTDAKGNKVYAEAPFEVQAHRGNYNHAFGIPQNTNAGLLSGFTAGLRSFEMDVFETAGNDGKSGKTDIAKGADNDVVVIHDAATNRTSGLFGSNPLYTVQNNSLQSFNNHMVHGVLDPAADKPRLDFAGVPPQTLKGALEFANTHLKGANLAIDARNDSVVGVSNILAEKRAESPNNNYDNMVTTKVYPQAQPDGFLSVMDKYVGRYTDGSEQGKNAAKAALAPMRFIPVLAAGQAPPSERLDGVSSLTVGDLGVATPKSYFGNSFNAADQHDVAQSAHADLEFAASFLGHSNVTEIELPAYPSPQSLQHSDGPGKDVAKNYAAGQTTLDAIQDMRDGKIDASLLMNDSSMRDELNMTRLGVSDRFADYYVAPRDSNGNVVDTKDQIKAQYYRLDNGAPETRDAPQVRIRNAWGEATKDTPTLQFSGPISVANSDGITDMTAVKMGVTGQRGIPATIRHHAQAVYKERQPGHENAPIASTYKPADWTHEYYSRTLFQDFLKTSPFSQLNFDESRQNISRIVPVEGYEDSVQWLDSWRNASNFRAEVQKHANGDVLKFKNNSYLIPFNIATRDKGNTVHELTAGYYSLSPKEGTGVFGLDAANNWYFGQPSGAGKASTYHFNRWTKSDGYVPNGTSESRKLIALGTENVPEIDLVGFFRSPPNPHG